MKKNARIICFYSYKGGSGRTTTLANVASLYAKFGAKVACLDLDINAPGLDIAFEGLIDKNNKKHDKHFLDHFIKSAKHPLSEISVKVNLSTMPDFRDLLISHYNDESESPIDINDLPNINNTSEEGQLWLFPIPRMLGNVGNIIHHMRGYPEGLGDEGHYKSRIESNIERICSELNLDYLFIDTRSGFFDETETLIDNSSDIVLFSRPSNQHREGTRTYLKRLHEKAKNRQKHTKKPFNRYLVINDIPIDIPEEMENKYSNLLEKRGDFAITIKTVKRMRWDDKVILFRKAVNNIKGNKALDILSDDELKEHLYLISKYYEIARKIDPKPFKIGDVT